MDEKLEKRQDELIDMVLAFCEDNLDEKHGYLAMEIVEEMSDMDNVPFRRGKLEIWASGVIYVLAQRNKLFNKTSPYHVSADKICNYFGTKKSTVSQKAKSISDALELSKSDIAFAFTIESDEEDMDDFFNKVYYLFSLGFADAALAKLDTVGEDNSEYGRALFYKSVILESLGKSDDAENLYKEAVISEVSKTSGIDAESLRNDDFKNVSDELDDITDSSIIFTQGLDFYENHDYNEALNYFDKALALNPNDSEILYYKSLALANLGDFEIALDMIERAIKLNSNEDRYWNDKANFLTRLGNFDEAEKCFNKAIELNPKDSVLFANKGFMYLQTDLPEKALESYRKAYELDSNNIHNIVCMANVYIELHDFPKADEYFTKAAGIDDENEEYLTAMAHYMMFQDELNESIEYWDKLLEIYPDRAEVWMYKSMVYLMMNNEFDAARCIEKASEMDPDIIDVFEDELSNL